MRHALRATVVAVAMLPGGAMRAGLDDKALRTPLVAGDLRIPWKVMSVAVLPGQRLDLSVPGSSTAYALRTDSGTMSTLGRNRWQWRAPDEAGRAKLEVETAGGDDAVSLNAFVMVPASRVRNGVLNGYRIGRYPSATGRSAIYQAPLGFIEVTAAGRDTKVSPHFKLGQFLAKQESGFPKYLVLDPRLLLKLERLLERVRGAGIDVDTLHVMSGYRTPSYNAAIGNVAYSRHVWGNAADVYVDGDGNGSMDDLTGDGRIDRDDAERLRTLVLEVERTAPDLVGGVASYAGTAAHGPFVHMDVRGRTATW